MNSVNQYPTVQDSQELVQREALCGDINNLISRAITTIVQADQHPGEQVQARAIGAKAGAMHTLAGSEWGLSGQSYGSGPAVPSPSTDGMYYSLTTEGKIVTFRRGDWDRQSRGYVGKTVHDLRELDLSTVGSSRKLHKHYDEIRGQYTDARRTIRHERLANVGAHLRSMGRKLIGRD